MYKKFKKVRDANLIKEYANKNNFCESCVWLKGLIKRSQLEIHHIFGNNKRTDELYNIISVCHHCHELATTHHLTYGSNSWSYNAKYLAIKVLKQELVLEDLDEWRKEDIEKALDEIQKNDKISAIREYL